MRLVAVSQRIDLHPERDERRDALDQRLVSFLADAGLLAVPVPNALAPEALAALLRAVAPAGVVLSGGNDLGACADRDGTERALLDHAATHRLPALGICRGMQMMAVAAGATLAPIEGHVRTTHALSGAVAGAANSFHAWGVASCPAGWAVLAQAEDRVIEAIGHDTLPWEGWMWHPEREKPFTARDVARARQLFGTVTP